MSILGPFFSPLLITALFLCQRRLFINPQWGSPSIRLTCTWAQGRKWLWHHSSANPLLSEKFFRYIHQKINVQININVTELKWVEYEHNTTMGRVGHIVILAHVITSSSIPYVCKDVSNLAPIFLLLWHHFIYEGRRTYKYKDNKLYQ